jgi:hypothetical protein
MWYSEVWGLHNSTFLHVLNLFSESEIGNLHVLLSERDRNLSAISRKGSTMKMNQEISPYVQKTKTRNTFNKKLETLSKTSYQGRNADSAKPRLKLRSSFE